MKTILLIAAAATVITSSMVAWKARSSARETAAVVTNTLGKIASADQRVGETASRLAAAETAAADARAALAEPQSGKGNSGATRARPSDAPGLADQEAAQKLAQFRAATKNPTSASQILRVHSQRYFFNWLFGPLQERFGLSPAQVEGCVEIALRLFETNLDLKALMDQGTISPTDPAVKRLQADADAIEAVGTRTLLGDALHQQVEEYRRTAIARAMVESWAGVTVLEGHPFTRQQLEQLVSVIANASSAYRSGGRMTIETVDWDELDPQLQSMMPAENWKLVKATANPTAGWTRTGSRITSEVAKAARREAAAKSSSN